MLSSGFYRPCFHQFKSFLKVFARPRPRFSVIPPNMSSKCSICGLPGHNKRTCPKKRPISPITGPPNASSQDNSAPAAQSPLPVPASAPPSDVQKSSESLSSPDIAGNPPCPDAINDSDTQRLIEELADDNKLSDAQHELTSPQPSTDDGIDEDYKPPESISSATDDSLTNPPPSTPTTRPKTNTANAKYQRSSAAPPTRVSPKKPKSRQPSIPGQSNQPPIYNDPHLSPTLHPGSWTQAHHQPQRPPLQQAPTPTLQKQPSLETQQLPSPGHSSSRSPPTPRQHQYQPALLPPRRQRAWR